MKIFQQNLISKRMANEPNPIAYRVFIYPTGGCLGFPNHQQKECPNHPQVPRLEKCRFKNITDLQCVSKYFKYRYVNLARCKDI